MLATGEGVDLPLAEITRVGQANLDTNLEQVKELAQRLSIEQGKAPEQGSASGSVNVSEIVADIGSRHPTAEALISRHAEHVGRPTPGFNRLGHNNGSVG